jgi:hypothetical protein
MGRLVMMVGSHSRDITLKKQQYSFKLQQTIEGKI